MNAKICSFLFLVPVLLCPANARSLECADYYPLRLGCVMTYQEAANPTLTRADSVCCLFEIGGEPAVRYGAEGDLQIVCWNDETAVTFFGVFNQGQWEDFEPDVVLGSLADGAKFTFNRPSAPEDTVFLRDWDALDPTLIGIYEIDPGYDDLVVVAYYDTDYEPNSQNTVIESNLPPGVTAPPGAVTQLEFRQAGEGQVVNLDIAAGNGELLDKWILISSVGIVGGRETTRRLPRLHQSRPNPFNPHTLIRYELAGRGRVTLEVFDVAGHLVRVLVDGEVQEAGTHDIVWDGRDQQARQMPTGTYYYRLRSGQLDQAGRMTLIR